MATLKSYCDRLVQWTQATVHTPPPSILTALTSPCPPPHLPPFLPSSLPHSLPPSFYYLSFQVYAVEDLRLILSEIVVDFVLTEDQGVGQGHGQGQGHWAFLQVP